MSESKIVSLAPVEPDQNIIRVAHDLLRWAESGSVTDIVVGLRHSDGLVTVLADSSGKMQRLVFLIGLAEYAAHKVKMQMYDSPEIIAPEDEDE